MAIFVDMAKEIKWEDFAEKFAVMVNDKYVSEILTSSLKEQKRVLIDWEDLAFDMQDFLMRLNGDQLIMCIEDMEFRLKLDLDTSIKLGFKNYPDTIDLDRCTQNQYTKRLVQVEGMIGSISAPLSFTSKIVWQCQSCDHHHTRVYDFYDKASNTTFCPECKRKTYNTAEHEEKTDFQILEIVRPVAIVGRTPESVRIILKNDLVEFGDVEDKRLVAGNRIKVIGINKDFPAYKASVRRKPYIDTMSWFVEKEFLKLTEEDIKEIKEMAKRENLIEDMIASVAPSIIGHEDVKLSMLLMSVGGVSKTRGDKTLKRGTIHVLLIGDPATAKTTLARWMTQHIPKSRYVVCSSLTKAGLGASLRRDEKLGYWYIDAGALLLANNSICIVDEADKASGDDLNQLDMVMENEQLTMTKVKTGDFPARTCVFALANPKHARFDPYMNPAEQVKMQGQTLSRFDLKFALKDTVNAERDVAIIKSKFIKSKPKIDEKLLVKYLYYAKQFEPKMNRECEQLIVDFYSDLRQKSQDHIGAVSITTRQADSIIRLSESFAKLRLSEDISKRDVRNAIKLIKAYLKTFGYDIRSGRIDIDLAERGKPKSKRDLIIKVLQIIREVSKKEGVATERIIVSRCEDENMERDFVLREAIPELRKIGDIFSPKFGHWSVVMP